MTTYRSVAAVALLVSLGACEKLASLMKEEATRDEQAKTLIASARKAMEGGDFEAATQLYQRASVLAPSDPEPHSALGLLFGRIGDDGQAILELRRVTELSPADSGARRRLAELFLRSGKADAAVEQLRKAVDASAEAPEPELMRLFATALLKAGKLDEAEAIAEKLGRIKADDPDTMALTAEVLIARRQEAAAVQLLDRAVELAAESASVRTARARYFYSRGKVNEALREFEIASKAAPEDFDLAMARARALAVAGRADEAATIMDGIVVKRPTDTAAQATAAEVKLLAGDVAGARDAAEAVLARQPRHPRALYVRARALESDAGDPVRAINAYREVVAVEPGQAEALSRLWRLYQKAGNKADAMSTLEHLSLYGDASLEEEAELAALYADTGINLSRAAKSIEAALKQEPTNARFQQIRQQIDARIKADRKLGLERPKPAPGGGGIEILTPGGR